MFQSSPTPKGGRYVTVDVSTSRKPRFVSILAHPERWALHVPCHGISAPIRFQSSPTPKGGRYDRTPYQPGHVTCFNPRPPRKVGATSRKFCHFCARISVSILAHPERWALRWPGWQNVSSPTPLLWVAITSNRCFNPRPPRKVGATFNALEPLDAVLPKFQGPPRKVGATPHCGPTMFQSSPTPKGGRYRVAPRGFRRPCVFGFNPRPPRKVGATLGDGPAHLAGCFNPRPPRKVGATGPVREQERQESFQSSPTPKGGRYA